MSRFVLPSLALALAVLRWPRAAATSPAHARRRRRRAPRPCPRPPARRGSVTGMPDKPGPGQVGPPQPVRRRRARRPRAIRSCPTDGDRVGPVAPIDPNAATVAGDRQPQRRRTHAAGRRRRDPRLLRRDQSPRLRPGLCAVVRRRPRQRPDAAAIRRRVSPTPPACRSRSCRPGAVDAAAGSRFIEVPVALTATARRRPPARFVGAYTLRRAVVDGATPDQRAWRIGSADIREVTP